MHSLRQSETQKKKCRKGMTLVELMISLGIFAVVVAGSISSSMFFAKIAADHENRADFSADMRYGMEKLGFDVRNATNITSRSDTGFRIALSSGSSAVYSFNDGVVTRTESGQTQNIFKNVSEFDVLTSSADEPADGSLTYDKARLSIEKLSFSAKKGSAGLTEYELTNFTFSKRNE